MKMQLHNKEDVRDLNGKYIVQIEEDKSNADIRTEFYFLKRIYRVILLDSTRIAYKGVVQPLVILHNQYGNDIPLPLKDFVDHFNNPHGKGERFFRLLKNKEIDWLCEQLKKFNY